MQTLTRAARRLVLMSTLAAAALCVGPAVGSAAAGLIPTSTTLAMSTDMIGPSGSATLTATVQFGLLITPTGKVTFTDQSNGDAVLGTAKLSSPCLLFLKQCKATLVISGSAPALVAGQNVIQASYSGDLLSKPSSGTGFLFTPQNSHDNVQCVQGQTCVASGTSPDRTAALNVQAGGSSNPGGESVLIAFGTEQMSCSTPSTGDIGVFSVSDPTVPESVVMDTFGAAAVAAQAAHPINNADGSGGHVCLAYPTPFTTASGAPATLQTNGFYEGVLAPCVFDAHGTLTNPPCYNGGSYTAGEGGPDYQTRTLLVSASPTDPHLGP